MSSTNRILAAVIVAASVGAAGAASAGQLLNATVVDVPFSPPSPRVQFLTPDLNSAGPGFATPSHANALAYGNGGIFGNFEDTHEVHRFSPAGVITNTFGGDPAYTNTALAFGNDTLFMGYGVETTFGVAFYSETFVFKDFFEVPEAVNGLAFAGDSLFVTYGDTLAKYDLAGNLLTSRSYAGFGVGFLAGSLAFGNSTLFMEFAQFVPLSGSTKGIGFIDPNTLSFNSSIETDEGANGLAFGDGELFASYDFMLQSYDMAGQVTGTKFTGIGDGLGLKNGALAFRPSTIRIDLPCDRIGGCTPAAVPEPGTWALLILGFGAVGSSLRATRRRLGALQAH